MSIRKRLIISNILMIVIPIVAFILIEIILGIYLFSGAADLQREEALQQLIFLRFIGLIVIIILTNGLLTYYVSKSILKPVQSLTTATQRIGAGHLDHQIKGHQHDEIGRLAEAFEQMRIKLSEAAELQRKYDDNRKELIANISHDLKTPITSIKGYVEGIRDGVAQSPEKLDRYIETIYTKAVDLDQLIDELFLYSKLDLGRLPFDFKELKINAFLAELLEEVRFDLQDKGVTLALHQQQTEDFTVMADPVQLKRVMTNMIQNSLKHLDKQTKEINIYSTAENETVTIEVRDNGSGIPKDSLPFIFDRFYRVDTARNTDQGGSGLGLAIVKRIIEQHDGNIWAISEPGQGTSIFFSLPSVDQR